MYYGLNKEPLNSDEAQVMLEPVREKKLDQFLDTSLSDNHISDDQSSLSSEKPIALPMNLRNQDNLARRFL